MCTVTAKIPIPSRRGSRKTTTKQSTTSSMRLLSYLSLESQANKAGWPKLAIGALLTSTTWSTNSNSRAWPWMSGLRDIESRALRRIIYLTADIRGLRRVNYDDDMIWTRPQRPRDMSYDTTKLGMIRLDCLVFSTTCNYPPRDITT